MTAPREHICPAKFLEIVPADEKYITHATFTKPKKPDQPVTLLLTTTKYYKIDSSNKKIWSKDLKEIHVAEPEQHPETIKIVYKLAPKSKVFGSDLATNYFRVRRFVAESTQKRDEWIMVVGILLRDLWQVHFEAVYMPAPEVYQLHLLVSKVAKATTANPKSGLTCLALSSERIYDIRFKAGSFEMGKPKWSYPIASLTKIKTYKNNNELITVVYNPNYPTKDKEQESSFLLRDEDERNLVIQEIRRIFFTKTKTHLLEETNTIGKPK